MAIDVPGMVWKVEGGVATITLNRPEQRNAVNNQILSALQEAFVEANDNDAIKVLVFNSVGKYFSSGGDVSALKDSTGKGGSEEKARRLNFYMDRNMLPTLSEQIDKPT